MNYLIILAIILITGTLVTGNFILIENSTKKLVGLLENTPDNSREIIKMSLINFGLYASFIGLLLAFRIVLILTVK